MLQIFECGFHSTTAIVDRTFTVFLFNLRRFFLPTIFKQHCWQDKCAEHTVKYNDHRFKFHIQWAQKCNAPY